VKAHRKEFHAAAKQDVFTDIELTK